MADDLRNVQSGDPLKIPASAWNTMVAAARKFRANGNGFSGSGIVEGLSSDPALTTVVRNDTLSAFTAGGPCGLSESLVNPLLYEHEARARTALSGIAPENGKAFGIALGPIPADGFGTVAVSGLTIAWVLLTDPADEYAGISDAGDTTHFVSNATRGPVRILWVPEGSVADDLVAAVVMFHGFGWPTRLGTAAGDDLYLPLVTKVCLTGMAPTVVPDGDYGYPLDPDGTEQDVSDTQSGESLTVERRVVTLPGDTPLGPPVCIVDPDDCCEADPVWPPDYPASDPAFVRVGCCDNRQISVIAYCDIEVTSGSSPCLDGRQIVLDYSQNGLWYKQTDPAICAPVGMDPISFDFQASLFCERAGCTDCTDGGWRGSLAGYPVPPGAYPWDGMTITSVTLTSCDPLTLVYEVDWFAPEDNSAITATITFTATTEA